MTAMGRSGDDCDEGPIPDQKIAWHTNTCNDRIQYLDRILDVPMADTGRSRHQHDAQRSTTSDSRWRRRRHTRSRCSHSQPSESDRKENCRVDLGAFDFRRRSPRKETTRSTHRHIQAPADLPASAKSALRLTQAPVGSAAGCGEPIASLTAPTSHRDTSSSIHLSFGGAAAREVSPDDRGEMGAEMINEKTETATKRPATSQTRLRASHAVARCVGENSSGC